MTDDRNKTPLVLPDAALAGPVHRFAHEAMACEWGVFIMGEERDYARQAAHAAFSEVDRLERELSRFVPQSDIARLNAQPPGEPLRISADTFECLEIAARICAETYGAFDVTVGAFTKRQRADANNENLPVYGMHLLEMHRPTLRVAIKRAGPSVDLGGIGKGHAIDHAVAVLREWSVGTALLHSGQSTVYAIGRPPSTAGWPVAIRHPADNERTLRRVALCDAALSGSGARLHGRHIFDPRTGKPAERPKATWAVAPTAAVADALSTAFMVLNPGETAAYCDGHPDVAALVFGDGTAREPMRHFGRSLTAP